MVLRSLLFFLIVLLPKCVCLNFGAKQSANKNNYNRLYLTPPMTGCRKVAGGFAYPGVPESYAGVSLELLAGVTLPDISAWGGVRLKPDQILSPFFSISFLLFYFSPSCPLISIYYNHNSACSISPFFLWFTTDPACLPCAAFRVGWRMGSWRLRSLLDCGPSDTNTSLWPGLPLDGWLLWHT